jgi:hypothetical protein
VATFFINRAPSKVITYTTPLECLFKMKPNYSSLRIFGCSYWPHLRPFQSNKLEFRSKECVFLGYSNKHKGFKCLNLSTGRTYISHDVVFDENAFPCSKIHPNAGPRLREEISLLPSSLTNNSPGGELVFYHMTNLSNTTDPCDKLQIQQMNIAAGTNNTTKTGTGTAPNADLVLESASAVARTEPREGIKLEIAIIK